MAPLPGARREPRVIEQHPPVFNEAVRSLLTILLRSLVVNPYIELVDRQAECARKFGDQKARLRFISLVSDSVGETKLRGS